MGKALYRTYRSKKLSEIIGQDHITTALEHAIKKGTISHAYLFTGPKGVGKTSIARILAHEINGLPYDDDRQDLDIIEIDAASNRRIDEIRDLRDKVHIAPTNAKYKVYIIDEVHMLTKEAFNALLKTLEEPPAHVVFILATTEIQKLPETIISRTQRYAFKPVELSKVTAHLKDISKKEKINITDEALELIASYGEGSFRDSISLLDQIRNSDKKIGLEEVRAMLGIAPVELIESILKSISEHNPIAVSKTLGQIHDQGLEPAQVAKQVGAALRASSLEERLTLPHGELINLLYQLVQVPTSPEPRVALEIALLDVTLSDKDSGSSDPGNKTTKTMSEEIQAQPSIKTKPERNTSIDTNDKITATASDNTTLLNDESWHLVLQAFKQKHSTLYGIAKMAKPQFEAGRLILGFDHSFHQKRLNETQNKSALAEVVTEITGGHVQIICLISEKSDLAKNPVETSIVSDVSTTNKSTAGIETISNIFGSAELLES